MNWRNRWVRLEGRMSTGVDVDIDLYARTAGHFRRICETLGNERRKRDVTPSLHPSRPRGAVGGAPGGEVR
jgi:hypothetical protein